jgi:N-acetyl-gamma-glutamyl-phosphate reductase
MRGLTTTAFVKPVGDVTPADLKTALARHYADHRWVTVIDEPGQGLGFRHVVGSHQALLAVGPSADGGLVPVFASIDNLMRGAASQAVHNLNLWFGLYAGAGLPAPLSTPAGVPAATHATVPGITRAIA